MKLDRPEARNAALIGELAEALGTLDADDEIRCVVLTGNERAFCAGADVKELADATAVEVMSPEGLASRNCGTASAISGSPSSPP